MNYLFEVYKKRSKAFAEKIASSYKKLFPINFSHYTVNGSNIQVDMPNISIETLDKLKESDGTLKADVYADITIDDGKTKKTKKHVKLGSIPIITPRRTFLINGVEYSLPDQLRLGYGIYPYIRSNGEITSQFNTQNGLGFRINYDPKTMQVYMSAGGRKIMLLPILESMGISLDKIRKAWGNAVFNANNKMKLSSYPKEVEKAVKVFANKKKADPTLLKDTLMSYKLDPKINKNTLGKEFESVSPEALLEASKAVIEIARGKRKPVDRDAIANKYAFTIPDYFDERISSSISKIKNQIIRKIKIYGTDVDKVFDSDYFSAPIDAMFKHYEQVSMANENNPFSVSGETSKITLMGTGGIKDTRQLTKGNIGINPSIFGFIDPVFTPDSDKMGAVIHRSIDTAIANKSLITKAYNTKSKTYENVDAQFLYNHVWSTSDMYEVKNGKPVPKHKKVYAFIKGERKLVSPSEVEYILDKHTFFNPVSLSVPFLSANQGNRAMLGVKLITQAVPLKDREEPLVKPYVQDLTGRKLDILKLLATQVPDSAVESPVDGTVTEIKDEYIKIRDKSGKLHKVPIYDYHPLNGESFINHEPIIKVGDKVKKGQVIAESNFTKNMTPALGKNLRIAYMPYHGQTVDDAFIVSETAAKKLTSLHLYKKTLVYDPEIDILNKSFYQSKKTLSPDNAAKLDNDGVVKKGVIVEPGDIIIAALRKKEVDSRSGMEAISRSLRQPFLDRSVKWDNDVPGKVVKVIKHGGKIEVRISTEEPAVVGDKITGSHANKGTIAAILPDAEMPRDKDGNPVEVIYSPVGVPSRINTGQLLETAASKIAEKTGKPFMVEQFSPEDYAKKIKNILKQHKLSDTEELILPSGRKVKVFTGKQYIYKLEHQAKKKQAARYRGAYDANLQPTKSARSSKGEAVEPLTLYSLMAHNKPEILKDVLYKSEKNNDFWRAIEFGLPLPPLKEPYSFNKLQDLIKGMGVKVQKHNDIITYMPATDKDIESMSRGKIQTADLVYGKNLKPIKGGLYDPDITGGLSGSNWAHIDLPTKIPNPLLVSYIAAVIGITQSDAEKIARETLYANPKTMDTSRTKKDGYYTGWDFFKRALGSIDIDKEIKKLQKEVKTQKNVTKLNKATRALRFLTNLKTSGINNITDTFLSKMPVLPPTIRPIYVTEDGTINSSDINKIYKDMILTSQKYQELKELGVPETDRTMKTLRSRIYDIYKDYQGITAIKKDDPAGILRIIKGRAEPKHGFFWSSVVKKRTDLSGHSVIGPDPTIKADEMIMPEKMAWVLYSPFVVRRLIQQGFSPIEAKRHLEKKDEVARKALMEEAKDRPVLLNRNPSLHKFNILAFKPRIMEIDQVKINPIVNKGFNADYDGDTMSIFVPATEAAKEEAKKMTPVETIWHPGKKKIMPEILQDAVIGIFKATAPPKSGKRPKPFESLKKATDAYESGQIDANDPVVINGTTTTYGRYLVNSYIPKKYRNYNKQFTKKDIMEIANKVAKTDKQAAADMLYNMQRIGSDLATYEGATVSLSDLVVPYKEREKLISEFTKKLVKEGPKAISHGVKKADEIIFKKIPDDNNLKQMMVSGAKGNVNQLRQMLVSPMIVNDANGKPVLQPISNSYAEGLTAPDYLITTYGARLGALERKKTVAVPGYLNKLLINAAADEVVVMEDCGTDKGVEMDINDPDIEGRYAAAGNMFIKKNTLITPDVISKLKSKNVKKVKVRSPLTCSAPKGVCVKCYGLKPDGTVPKIGDNVGIESAQTIMEPLSQMTMNVFHSGGVARSKVEAFSVLDKITTMLTHPVDSPYYAELSTKTGKVESIKDAPGGGKIVTVSGVDHFIPPSKADSIIVKRGDKVESGDQLTAGMMNYRKLAELRGRDTVQKKLLHNLDEFYRSAGQKVDKKIMEVVTRTMTNVAEVQDPGSAFGMVKGDFVTYTTQAKINRALQNKTPIEIEYAIGYELGESVGGYRKGELITPTVMDNLRRKGITKVKIQGVPAKIKPTITSVANIPAISQDISDKLTAEQIVKNLQTGLATGTFYDPMGTHKTIRKYIAGKL